jgi:hypothetical protein
MLLKLGAGSFDERAVVDAGRANGLAGAAVEALVHLLVEDGIEEIEAAVRDGAHHPKTTAGGGHLLTGQTISGARRKAHPTVDAGAKEIGFGNVLTVKTAEATKIGFGCDRHKCRGLPGAGA